MIPDEFKGARELLRGARVGCPHFRSEMSGFTNQYVKSALEFQTVDKQTNRQDTNSTNLGVHVARDCPYFFHIRQLRFCSF